jgi:hypothetical protein
MRNITATPDSVLAYHKLHSRFTADIYNEINTLDHLSIQEYDTFADLLLSECSDYSQWGEVLIPLIDAGSLYCGEDLRQLRDVHWWHRGMLKKSARKEDCYLVFWFVSFVWLNETNQMNQINKTNQINQMDQTDRACLRHADHQSSRMQKSFPEPARAGVY